MNLDAVKLLEVLDKSIAFHANDQNDPYIGNAVRVALLEVREAIAQASGAPKSEARKVREFNEEFGTSSHLAYPWNHIDVIRRCHIDAYAKFALTHNPTEEL